MGFAAADLFSMLKGKPFDYVNIFTSVCSRKLPTFLKNAVKSTAANGSLAPFALFSRHLHFLFLSFFCSHPTRECNCFLIWREAKQFVWETMLQAVQGVYLKTDFKYVSLHIMWECFCKSFFFFFACKQFVWPHSYILRFKNTHFMVRNTLKESKLHCGLQHKKICV